jgi:transcriptional regulator with GAF, ATPase, and Fis domain
MPDLPSRTALASLSDRAAAIFPCRAVGFVRALEDARAWVLQVAPNGVSAHVVPQADLPPALCPEAGGRGRVDFHGLQGHGTNAIEWQLTSYGVRRVVAASLPDTSPTRFWVGTDEIAPPTTAQIDAFSDVAGTAAGMLDEPLSPDAAAERYRRLDLAAELIPTLLHVLDVREVFNRISATANGALPHDRLMLRVFSHDLTSNVVFAGSGEAPVPGPPVSHVYPPALIRAWEYSIIDDMTRHTVEADGPLAATGARSTLRLPIRFAGRIIGGLAFLSLTPSRFASTDLAVGRRLADHVASALSHHALAQQLADEARRNAELQARSASLETLDGMLTALIDTGSVAADFGRISTMAAKVLSHDAASIMIRLPDKRHARRFAAVGLPTDLPEVSEIPANLLANPDWTHDVIDDLRARDTTGARALVANGFLSGLQVSLRHDERFAGALLFFSKTPNAFKEADVPVARRIADRLAVTLARDRELDAERRADEATDRAARLESRVRALTDELDARTGYRRVVGESKPWRQVLTQATQVAATETTALLLGESGTGKEVVARFVHRASPRSGGPFVAINCAALPEQLLEAELFGYERGAFTGATQSKPGQLEQAAGGTLFLDEVGEMSPSAQAKFLRVLQEREFQRLGGTRVLRSDARVVAATNRDLPRAIANGQFREDLYYRLNVFAIRLPALRERPDDILPLADAFLSEIGRGLGRPPAGVSRDAKEMLTAYRWPGNVRELRNILERAAILCEGGLVTAEYLGLNIAPPVAQPAPQPLAAVGMAVTEAMAGAQSAPAAVAAPPSSAEDLASIEKVMIETALQNARFNKSKAAKALGMTRHQLYIRMRKHGLE